MPLALIAAGAWGQQPPAPAARTIKVTVLDSAGKPAQGITVARAWTLDASGLKPLPNAPSGVTAADGTVSLAVPGSNAISVAAFDAAKGVGAAAMAKAGGSTEVTLRLAPLARVRGSVAIEGWEGALPDGGRSVMLTEGDASSFLLSSRLGAGELLLPPGKYVVHLFTPDTAPGSKTFEVKGPEPVDLGEIKLEMTLLAKNYGKPAFPLKGIADARGVPKDAKLEDFRGKWVFLEFWGFW